MAAAAALVRCTQEGPMHVDYHFTPVSPWTWLGHARFVQLLQRHRELACLPVRFDVREDRVGDRKTWVIEARRA